MAARWTPVIAVDAGGIRYFLSTADRDLARGIFVHGRYEQPMMRSVVAALSQLRRGRLEGRLFIDVGANIGTATLSAMCEFGASGAVALEPDPQNFKLLQQNLLANGLLDGVLSLQVAASDHEGVVELDVFPSHHGSHRVRHGDNATWSHLDEQSESTRARATTLDTVFRDANVALADVGLVWIDTEGHEAQVLLGAEQLVRSDVPVLIEFWPAALRAANGLEPLASLISAQYTHVVDLTANVTRPATEIRTLALEYDRMPFPWTDLLLLSR